MNMLPHIIRFESSYAILTSCLIIFLCFCPIKAFGQYDSVYNYSSEAIDNQQNLTQEDETTFEEEIVNEEIDEPTVTQRASKKQSKAHRNKRSNGKDVFNNEKETEKFSSLTDEEKDALMWVGIIAAAIFIIAQILCHTTECVILYSWYDLLCMILFFVFIIVSLFFTDGLNELRESNPTMTVVGLLLFYSLPLIAMIVISIKSNLGHGFLSVIYIIVSILTKFIVLILVPLFVIGWCMAKSAGSDIPKDGRFKDGTRGNGKTAAVARAMAIFSFFFTILVATLIKDDD